MSQTVGTAQTIVFSCDVAYNALQSQLKCYEISQMGANITILASIRICYLHLDA